MRRPLVILVGLTLALPVALPVHADWLVTVEGARIETRGPWTVSRNQVVFTAANGTLSTLRLDDIDLAASHDITVGVAEPVPSALPAAKPKPVAVITDRDIPRGKPAPPPATHHDANGPLAEAGATPAETPSETQCLEVTFWRVREGEDGVVLHGTLRNDGPSLATDISLVVEVENVTRPGEWLEATAFLEDTTLAPGLTTTFRAIFPSSAGPQSPRFEVRCVGVSVRPAPRPDSESEADPGDLFARTQRPPHPRPPYPRRVLG